METVERGQVTFAWHAKDMGDALSNQALNEQVSGNLGHGMDGVLG
jgi:hypothetical protein